jgi:hypothetical protein
MTDLMQWARTVRDVEVLEAVAKHGSYRKAAVSLGVCKSTIDGVVARAKARAARQDADQHISRVSPDGFGIEGTTTLFKDGKATLQWVKTRRDAERQAEMQRAAIEALCDDIPRVKPTYPELETHNHLCNVYTLTDSHVGMRAHADEGGADWDLEISERVLTGLFEKMIFHSPKASTCVLAELGDFNHFDSLLPVTPGHGHVLDAASRLSQMIKMAVRILRRAVDMCLAHHDKVIVLLAEGNHDPASSAWLRVMFSALYENEPRVQVIDSEHPYYVYQHGKTMLAWHHGHLKKNDQLPMLFASQFANVWGSSTKRYAHCGHRHHLEIRGHNGMTVTQHTTLAPNDAHSSRHGYDTDRHVTSYTYSDTYGQVASNTLTPEMLQ